MKFYLYFLFVFVLVSSSAFSQENRFKWDWVQEADSNNYEAVNDVVVDTLNGWVYAVGGFENNLSANYGGALSNGGIDGFVSKFDTIGNLIWSFSIGGNDDDEILGIDLDPSSGDIYIVGYGGNVTFGFNGTTGGSGTGTNIATGGKDVILSRYDSNGALNWFCRDGGNGDDIGRDVIVDKDQNKVVYTGEFDSQMELNSTTINMGPNDGDKHMFIGCRKKNNSDGIWRAFSQSGGYEKGVALTYDDAHFYLAGDYNGVFNIIVQTAPSYTTDNTSSFINEGMNTNENIFFCRFKKNNGDMGVVAQSASWFYSIYGLGSDFAGAIHVKNDKLYVGGAASNNVVFNDAGTETTIVGSEAFVSIHNLLTGDYYNKIIERNIGASTYSMVNSISCADDLIVIGGHTTGTIRFNGNSSYDIIANSASDGFVAFYDTSTSFIEVHEVGGSGQNEVTGLSGRGKDVFVCGKFGSTAILGSDLQMNEVDGEAGFLSLITHRLCKPRIEYGFSSICNESSIFSPSFIEDTLDVFYQAPGGLTLDAITGSVNPLTSLIGIHQIVHETYKGCSDTTILEIIGGEAPAFTIVQSDTTLYTTSSSCEVSFSYSLPQFNTDCGTNNLTQIDASGLVSGSTFNVGTTAQVFELSDGYNDNDTCRFSITVLDTVSPFINCPEDATFFSSNGNCGANVNLFATASDSCGLASLSQTGDITHLMGSFFPVQTAPYEIEFTATDIYNNVNTCSFTVLVRDTTPPTVSNCPTSDFIVYAGTTNCSQIVDYGNVTATDDCGAVIEDLVGLPTNSSFPIDTTLINYTFTDNYSNISTCQFNVIVIDSLAPVINCSSDTVRFYTDNNSCLKAVTFAIPSAGDNCLFDVVQTYGIQSGTVQAVGLNYYLEFEARDSSGNLSNCRIEYEVLDNIGPLFTNCPNDVILEGDIDLCGEIYSFDSIASTDNCSLFFPTGSNYANQTDVTGFSSGDVFPIGTTSLSFDQQDIYGNTSICTFSIQVNTIQPTVFNSSISNGICINSDSLDLESVINGNNMGDFYVNGVANHSGYYVPPSFNTSDTIQYVLGDNGCEDTIRHVILIHDFNTEAGVDSISICGLEVSLEALKEPNSSHYWEANFNVDFYPNDTVANPNVIVSSEGEYEFVWFEQIDDCINTDTVYVNFYEEPIANSGASITIEEDEVYLNAFLANGSGVWTVEESTGIIDDSSAYNTLVSNLNLGLNTFQWTVSNGPCLVNSSVVRVFYSFLTIPNAFTPNGDGVNDVFQIEGFELYSDASIKILDRWGGDLFMSDDSNSFWDGNYKGEEVVEDTYFYILFVDGKEYTGYIELRR